MTSNTNGRLNRPICRSYSYIVKIYNDYDRLTKPTIKYYLTQKQIVDELNISKSSILKLINNKVVRDMHRYDITKLKVPVCDMESHLMGLILSL